MSLTTENIQINITANADTAAASIQKVSDALDKLKTNFNALKIDRTPDFKFDVKDTAVKRIQNLAAAMSELRRAMAPTSGRLFTDKIQVSPDAAKNLRRLVHVIRATKSELNGFKFNMSVKIPSDASERLMDLANTIHKINQTMPDVNGFGISIQGAAGSLNHMAGSAKKAGSSTFFLDKAITSVGKSIGHWFVNQVKSASKALAKFSAQAPFKALLAPMGSLINGFKGIHQSLGGMLSSLKRIAMYRLFRTMIKEFTQGLQEGMENLYHYSENMGTNFHKSMNSIASSALYIKNSLATIAEPIVNAIAPAIEDLADKFAALAENVAHFLASLFGQATYSKALRVPKAMYEESQKATKELQKWIGPFDEINRLNAPNAASSGESEDWSKMFETLTVEGEGPVAEWITKLKEGINSGDLSEIGALLANKLSEALGKINWKDVKAKAKKIGKMIGTGITGFLTATDENGQTFPQAFAKAIGEALNTAVDGVSSFIENTNFQKIGESLGAGLKTFFETFDFGKALGTIVSLSTGIITMVTNAIGKVDWNDVGTKIGNAIKSVDWPTAFGKVKDLGVTVINSFIDMLTGFNNTGALQSTLSSLGENIAKFFKEIKWKEAFEAIGNIASVVVKAMLDVIIELTDGEDNVIKQAAEGVGNAIGEFFKDPELWEKAFKAVTNLGKAMVQGLFAAVGGLLSGLTGKDINLTIDDKTAETIFSTLFAGVTITKLLTWIFGKGGSGAATTALSLGGSKITLAVAALTVASMTVAALSNKTHWNPEKSPIALDWDEPRPYDVWLENLTDYQKSLLSEVMHGMTQLEIDTGRDVYGEAFSAFQNGVDFGEWYTKETGKPYEPYYAIGVGDADPKYNGPSSGRGGGTIIDRPEFNSIKRDFGENNVMKLLDDVGGDVDKLFKAYDEGRIIIKKIAGKEVPKIVEQAKDALQKYSDTADGAGESIGSAADEAESLTKGIKKMAKPMESVRGTFINSSGGIVSSLGRINGAVNDTRLRMNQTNPIGENKFVDASDTIVGSAVVSANSISDVGGSVNRLYARNTRTNALGQNEYGDASETIKDWAEIDEGSIGSLHGMLDTLSNRNKRKNPLGEDEFGTAASKLMQYADEGKQHIEGIEEAADTVAKRFQGKNPLGHEGFDTETDTIKSSARAAAEEIIGVGTSAETAAGSLESGMSDMGEDVTGFKNGAMTELNAFSQGMTRGMGQTMSDFVDAGNHGLDTMLKNYKKFSEETAKLMSNTAATYTQTTFYRYSREGAPTPTIKPFAYDTMMADGGFLEQGEAFIARESGPELVGRIGRRSAVVNNDQIVASVSAGVSDANEDVVNAIYAGINQVVNTIRENRAGNGTVNWDAVARQITRAQRRQAAAAGT